eukprot:scaffold62153_cov61-Phaeocystis_antarctica.AAC.8
MPLSESDSKARVPHSATQRTHPVRAHIPSAAPPLSDSLAALFRLSKATRGGPSSAPSLPSGSASARTTRTACPFWSSSSQILCKRRWSTDCATHTRRATMTTGWFAIASAKVATEKARLY